MNRFKRKRESPVPVQTVPAGQSGLSLPPRCPPLSTAEQRLYTALRESVPIIDAAICKTARLIGGFTVRCENREVERRLNRFLLHVRVGAAGEGMESFLSAYLEQLLTYGTAVGEILPAGGDIAALYNAPLEDIELKAPKGPLDMQVCVRAPGGESRPVPYPALVLTTALNPRPGELYGQSLLRGLPFVAGILLKIYDSIGKNWERVGNVRFAVTYKPGSDPGDRAYAKERAQAIAREWGKAMQPGGRLSDFVAVGDVQVKVIGADNQILESEIPVRQMLEQIVAKLGVPPFLLGLSWSTTERMSSQQADLLTSELAAYRRLLHPVICRVCSLWLRLHGYPPAFEVEWSKINLQDEVELSAARLNNAKARQIEENLEQHAE